MSLSALILPSIVAIVLFLLCMVVAQMLTRKETMHERVQRIAGGAAQEEDTEAGANELYAELEPSAFASALEKCMRVLGIDTDAFRRKSQLLFYRAGVGSPDAPIYYLFFKRVFFVFLLLPVAWLFFSPAEGLDKALNIIVGLILLAGALAGPDLYIQNKRVKREKRLIRSFPDTVDLLLACVESGLALDGALARVCKELARAYPDITQELNKTRGELTLLNDRPQALHNLAERTDIHIFRLLVTTLLQSERFGTSLAETLRVLTDDSRHTQLMKAEEKAGRLPAMMTLPLVLFLLPALFIIVLGPAILTTRGVIHSMNSGEEERGLR